MTRPPRRPAHRPLLDRRLLRTRPRRRARRLLLALANPPLLALILLAALPGVASAGTGGADLPWNHPLQVVTDNLTGPTAKTVAALAFVIGGAMWAFTSHEQGARRFGMALFGVAVVLGSVNLINQLGFEGALF
jgi:type IV secretory pathway VirB2 component (pilin)